MRVREAQQEEGGSSGFKASAYVSLRLHTPADVCIRSTDLQVDARGRAHCVSESEKHRRKESGREESPCVCVCVCACVCVYTHTYIHAYIHTYMYIYIYTYMYAYIHI
jgi:hypothetical protein